MNGDSKKEREEKVIDPFDELDGILKDHWAFWLDAQKEAIEKIHCQSDRQRVLLDFERGFLNQMRHWMNEDGLRSFLSYPEAATKLGMAHLSKKHYEEARHCFNHAIELGDQSAAAHIGLAVTVVKDTQGEKRDHKKMVRHHLKEGQYQVEQMKQGLMSTLKIADILAESVGDEDQQVVSNDDNDFKRQVEGKLEVLGLHLHYLENAIGSYIEPFDFIDPSKVKEPQAQDYKKSRAIYKFLIEKNILHGDRVRKYFQRNQSKLADIVNKHIDASIAQQVIGLLQRDAFDKKALAQVVCHAQELWDGLLLSGKDELVYILDMQNLEANLEAKYISLWEQIKTDINPIHLQATEGGKKLLEESQYQAFRQYLKDKNLLRETRRIKFVEIQYEKINGEDKYVKYRTVMDEEGKPQSIAKFFEELAKFKAENLKVEQGSEYLYQNELPFEDAKAEANKIWILLKEQRILKSGGLNQKYKYGDTKDELNEALDNCLKDSPYLGDIDFIKQKVMGIQGDIRSFDGKFKATLMDFMDLEGQENIPKELHFFAGLCLDKFLILEEDKSWWNWYAFVVAMIGLAQVIAGAVLCTFGVINIGNALIMEGINDMVYAVMAGISGQFRWKEWAIQKAVSMAVSIVTAGISALAAIGKIVQKVGSMSRMAMFSKVLAKAAIQFGTMVLTNLVTDKVLGELLNELVEKIVNTIEANILSDVQQRLQAKLEQLYIESVNDEAFYRKVVEFETKIETALGKDPMLPRELNQVKTRIMASVSGHIRISGNSKVAKALKAAQIADNIWKAVEVSIQVQGVVKVFNDIMSDAIPTGNKQKSKRHIDPNLINVQAEKLNAKIKDHIRVKLSAALHATLTSVISKGLNAAVEAGTKIASEEVKKHRARQQARKPQEVTKTYVAAPQNKKPSKKSQDAAHKREQAQKTVIDPKEHTEEKSRPLDRADIKMLADRKRRTIKIYNQATGKVEVIHPHGLRRVVAGFKNSAHIEYAKGMDRQPGHFSARNGLANGYVQPLGDNNCLLIAYETSLGRKVDINFIGEKRNKLYAYTESHKSTFFQSKANIQSKGHDQMIGAGNPNTRYLRGIVTTTHSEKANQFLHKKGQSTTQDSRNVVNATGRYRGQAVNQPETVAIRMRVGRYTYATDMLPNIVEGGPGVSASSGGGAAGHILPKEYGGGRDHTNLFRQNSGLNSGLHSTTHNPSGPNPAGRAYREGESAFGTGLRRNPESDAWFVHVRYYANGNRPQPLIHNSSRSARELANAYNRVRFFPEQRPILLSDDSDTILSAKRRRR